MEFRKLTEKDIDCRVAMAKPNGCSLLLYKNARVDMNLLDEVVGAENWQRKHEIINGNLYCSVGIWSDKRGEWIWKQDVGTESNTEAEKGQASDSFKRACFNWGIGRELYTAPFIWVNAGEYDMDDKSRPKTSFEVSSIGYTGNEITSLEIINSKTGKVVYSLGKKATKTAPTENKMEAPSERVRVLKYINSKDKPADVAKWICTKWKVEKIDDLTDADIKGVIKTLEDKGEAI